MRDKSPERSGSDVESSCSSGAEGGIGVVVSTAPTGRAIDKTGNRVEGDTQVTKKTAAPPVTIKSKIKNFFTQTAKECETPRSEKTKSSDNALLIKISSTDDNEAKLSSEGSRPYRTLSEDSIFFPGASNFDESATVLAAKCASERKSANVLIENIYSQNVLGDRPRLEKAITLPETSADDLDCSVPISGYDTLSVIKADNRLSNSAQLHKITVGKRGKKPINLAALRQQQQQQTSFDSFDEEELHADFKMEAAAKAATLPIEEAVANKEAIASKVAKASNSDHVVPQAASNATVGGPPKVALKKSAPFDVPAHSDNSFNNKSKILVPGKNSLLTDEDTPPSKTITAEASLGLHLPAPAQNVPIPAKEITATNETLGANVSTVNQQDIRSTAVKPTPAVRRTAQPKDITSAAGSISKQTDQTPFNIQQSEESKSLIAVQKSKKPGPQIPTKLETTKHSSHESAPLDDKFTRKETSIAASHQPVTLLKNATEDNPIKSVQIKESSSVSTQASTSFGAADATPIVAGVFRKRAPSIFPKDLPLASSLPSAIPSAVPVYMYTGASKQSSDKRKSATLPANIAPSDIMSQADAANEKATSAIVGTKRGENVTNKDQSKPLCSPTSPTGPKSFLQDPVSQPAVNLVEIRSKLVSESAGIEVPLNKRSFRALGITKDETSEKTFTTAETESKNSVEAMANVDVVERRYRKQAAISHYDNAVPRLSKILTMDEKRASGVMNEVENNTNKNRLSARGEINAAADYQSGGLNRNGSVKDKTQPSSDVIKSKRSSLSALMAEKLADRIEQNNGFLDLKKLERAKNQQETKTDQGSEFVKVSLSSSPPKTAGSSFVFGTALKSSSGVPGPFSHVTQPQQFVPLPSTSKPIVPQMSFVGNSIGASITFPTSSSGQIMRTIADVQPTPSVVSRYTKQFGANIVPQATTAPATSSSSVVASHPPVRSAPLAGASVFPTASHAPPLEGLPKTVSGLSEGSHFVQPVYGRPTAVYSKAALVPAGKSPPKEESRPGKALLSSTSPTRATAQTISAGITTTVTVAIEAKGLPPPFSKQPLNRAFSIPPVGAISQTEVNKSASATTVSSGVSHQYAKDKENAISNSKKTFEHENKENREQKTVGGIPEHKILRTKTADQQPAKERAIIKQEKVQVQPAAEKEPYAINQNVKIYDLMKNFQKA